MGVNGFCTIYGHVAMYILGHSNARTGSSEILSQNFGLFSMKGPQCVLLVSKFLW